MILIIVAFMSGLIIGFTLAVFLDDKVGI